MAETQGRQGWRQECQVCRLVTSSRPSLGAAGTEGAEKSPCESLWVTLSAKTQWLEVLFSSRPVQFLVPRLSVSSSTATCIQCSSSGAMYDSSVQVMLVVCVVRQLFNPGHICIYFVIAIVRNHCYYYCCSYEFLFIYLFFLLMHFNGKRIIPISGQTILDLEANLWYLLSL